MASPDLQIVANPDRRGCRVSLAVRDSNQNFVDTDLFGILARSASDIHKRLPTFFIENFDIQPADALHKASAQHLHDGFFGRPAPGEGLVAVLSFLAVFDLFRRVDAVNERLGMPLDHFGNSSNLDDVCSESDDHRNFAFRIEATSRVKRLFEAKFQIQATAGG